MPCTLISSPIGPLTAAADPGGPITRLAFGTLDGAEDDGALPELRDQLAEYFAGRRRSFELEVAPAGTDWQRRVWDELTQIPYGETRSYGQVAARACQRTGAHAARAVGAANHANPVAILVPCHRVIGANGALVGFGGGLAVKRRLLDLESGRLALL